MKSLVKIFAGAAFLLFAAVNLSLAQDIGITELVDKYSKDTDIQRAAITGEYLGKNITVSGTVADVRNEDTFDIVNDVKRYYYKVITEPENTPAGNSYRAILIYKDKAKVENINKGQKITFGGNIIKVLDERLYLSVWLSADDLTPAEKELFK